MFQGGSLWTGIIAGTTAQLRDHQRLRKGKLSSTQYTAHTAKNITGSVGVMAGVEYGALIGTSILPGVGTVCGPVAGALIGGQIGHVFGKQVDNIVRKQNFLRRERAENIVNVEITSTSTTT